MSLQREYEREVLTFDLPHDSLIEGLITVLVGLLGPLIVLDRYATHFVHNICLMSLHCTNVRI